MKKSLKYSILAVLLILFMASYYVIYQSAPVATGYSSKYLCSHTFNSGQDPEEAMEAFIKPVNPLFNFVDYQVDYDRKQVSTSLFGLIRPATAVYREGCGCTLLVEKGRDELLAQTQGLNTQRIVLKDTLWPWGNQVDLKSIPANVNIVKLKERIRQEFKETTTDLKERKNTLAIAVAYKDRIIAEQYREGIDANTPLLSWSASKSITSALIGRLVQTHQQNIYQAAGLQEWQHDERKNITIDHLLRMESGLAFDERYVPFSDAVEMLYESSDMGAYAAEKSIVANPGTQWRYSSGTTNLLSKILLEKTGGDIQSLKRFAYEEFFNKLGMTTAIFEHDESGAFVGSSYFYASARDWLRFCLLYKNKGIWNGEQLLPEGWVDYSLTPTSHAPEGRYGAQIWLNAGEKDTEERLLPRLPKDTFVFQGYQGQWFVVIPSKDLMIARFGVTNTPQWSMEDLILDILDTIQKEAV